MMHLIFVDNTFLTPALKNHLTLGADIVLHSATKFLSGHSDVVAGLAVVKDPDLAEKLYFFTKFLWCHSWSSRCLVRSAWFKNIACST